MRKYKHKVLGYVATETNSKENYLLQIECLI